MRLDLRCRALFLLFSLGMSPVSASGLYDIEILIFQNSQTVRLDGEQFSDEAVKSPLSTPSIDIRPSELQELGIDEQALQDLFAELEADSLELNSIREYLERSSSYHPVLHLGWRQPSFGDEQAVAVRMGNFELPLHSDLNEPQSIEELLLDPDGFTLFAGEHLQPGQLLGWLRLRTSLYLHIDIDFFLGTYEHTAPLTVRLQESRRVKFKELHYFDHPLFALLVQVRPVSEDQDIDQEIIDDAG
jgi:hypothetical protein